MAAGDGTTEGADAGVPAANVNVRVVISRLRLLADRHGRRYATMTVTYEAGGVRRTQRAIAFGAGVASMGTTLAPGPATVYGRAEDGRFVVLGHGLAGRAS